MIRQAHVEQDRIRHEFAGQVVTLVSTVGDQTHVTQLMGEVIEDASEVGLVLHHQNATSGKRRLVAVIGEARDDRRNR